MSLFGAIVRTAVNVVALPVVIVADAVTLHGISTNSGKSPLVEHIKKLKEEADA